MNNEQNLTQLLTDWKQGDQQALERLMPLVYDELHRLAHNYMRRENPGHSMQTTALVNEAYLRLTEGKPVDWQDRTHFFAISARVMRRVLIDLANARQQQKHGSGGQRLALDEVLELSADRDGELIALDDAMQQLAKVDPRKAQVIELRYFGGLSIEETAAVLNVSPDTVMRDWRLAKVWLLRELSEEKPGGVTPKSGKVEESLGKSREV